MKANARSLISWPLDGVGRGSPPLHSAGGAKWVCGTQGCPLATGGFQGRRCVQGQPATLPTCLPRLLCSCGTCSQVHSSVVLPGLLRRSSGQPPRLWFRARGSGMEGAGPTLLCNRAEVSLHVKGGGDPPSFRHLGSVSAFSMFVHTVLSPDGKETCCCQ